MVSSASSLLLKIRCLGTLIAFPDSKRIKQRFPLKDIISADVMRFPFSIIQHSSPLVTVNHIPFNFKMSLSCFVVIQNASATFFLSWYFLYSAITSSSIQLYSTGSFIYFVTIIFPFKQLVSKLHYVLLYLKLRPSHIE